MDFKSMLLIMYVGLVVNLASIACALTGSVLAYEGKPYWWAFLIGAAVLHSGIQLPVSYEDEEEEEGEGRV